MAGKEFACNVGDLGSIPGLGRSPGEGKGHPLQYSGLENSMDCVVHGVTKSWTRLSDFYSHGDSMHPEQQDWHCQAPSVELYSASENQAAIALNYVCEHLCFILIEFMYPWWLSSKESACNAGNPGSIPGWGRWSGEGNGYPLQYSSLENSMDGEPDGLQSMGSVTQCVTEHSTPNQLPKDFTEAPCFGVVEEICSCCNSAEPWKHGEWNKPDK